MAANEQYVVELVVNVQQEEAIKRLLAEMREITKQAKMVDSEVKKAFGKGNVVSPQATSQLGGFSSKLKELGINSQNSGYMMQNFGYQLNDIVVMLGQGIDPARVMSQQIPQIFSGMGKLTGPIQIAIAAVSAFWLLSKKLNSTLDAQVEKLKELSEQLDETEKRWKDFSETGDTTSQAIFNIESNMNLEEAQKQIKDFTETNQNGFVELAKYTAESFSPVVQFYKDLFAGTGQFIKETYEQISGSILDLTGGINDAEALAKKFAVPEKAAKELVDEVKALNKEVSVSNFLALEQQLIALANSGEFAGEELRQVVDALIKVQQQRMALARAQGNDRYSSFEGENAFDAASAAASEYAAGLGVVELESTKIINKLAEDLRKGYLDNKEYADAIKRVWFDFIKEMNTAGRVTLPFDFEKNMADLEKAAQLKAKIDPAFAAAQAYKAELDVIANLEDYLDPSDVLEARAQAWQDYIKKITKPPKKSYIDIESESVTKRGSMQAEAEALLQSIDPQRKAFAEWRKDIEDIVRLQEHLSPEEQARLMKAATAQYQEAVKGWSMVDEMFKAWDNSFKSFADGIARGTTDIKDAFENMAKSLLATALRLMANKLIFNMLGGPGGGDIATAFGKQVGILPSAHGNVFDSGHLVPFARGGIVTAPTVFPMARGMGLMGEAGPEAVMPLTRLSGGDLGVKAAPVNVTINNNASGVDVATSTNADGSLNIDIISKAIANQIATGGSAVAGAIERAYGVGRGASAY